MGELDPARTRSSEQAKVPFNEREHELEKLDRAWAVCALAFRTDWRFGLKRGELRARSLVQVAEAFESLRRAYESGDTFALLEAVTLAAEEVVPVPTWCALAFVERIGRFRTEHGPHSLDTLFDIKPPTTSATARRRWRDWRLGVELSRAIAEHMRAGGARSFDDALAMTLRMGGFPIGKTKARELVLNYRRIQAKYFGKRRQLFSQFRRKVRKAMT